MSSMWRSKNVFYVLDIWWLEGETTTENVYSIYKTYFPLLLAYASTTFPNLPSVKFGLVTKLWLLWYVLECYILFWVPQNTPKWFWFSFPLSFSLESIVNREAIFVSTDVKLRTDWISEWQHGAQFPPLPTPPYSLSPLIRFYVGAKWSFIVLNY